MANQTIHQNPFFYQSLSLSLSLSLYIYIYIYIFKRHLVYLNSQYLQKYFFLYLVLFGLVSLLNGISTFVGYLMPKLFSSKDSSGTI